MTAPVLAGVGLEPSRERLEQNLPKRAQKARGGQGQAPATYNSLRGELLHQHLETAAPSLSGAT